MSSDDGDDGNGGDKTEDGDGDGDDDGVPCSQLMTLVTRMTRMMM